MKRIAVLICCFAVLGCASQITGSSERHFQIKGHVSQPGQYVLTEGMTLLKAIVTAGGFTSGDKMTARIHRAGQVLEFPVYKIESPSRERILIMHQDIVVIKQKIP